MEKSCWTHVSKTLSLSDFEIIVIASSANLAAAICLLYREHELPGRLRRHSEERHVELAMAGPEFHVRASIKNKAIFHKLKPYSVKQVKISQL